MSDVVLDDGGDQVTVQCQNLNVQGHDLLLDFPQRRRPGGPTFRRALVHDQTDGLTMNFGGDYPGGVTLNGVAGLSPLPQPGIGSQDFIPTLVIHGGISYEVQGLKFGGPTGDRPTRITVSLEEEIGKLQSQIADLVTKVAALEAKK